MEHFTNISALYIEDLLHDCLDNEDQEAMESLKNNPKVKAVSIVPLDIGE